MAEEQAIRALHLGHVVISFETERPTGGFFGPNFVAYITTAIEILRSDRPETFSAWPQELNSLHITLHVYSSGAFTSIMIIRADGKRIAHLSKSVSISELTGDRVNPYVEIFVRLDNEMPAVYRQWMIDNKRSRTRFWVKVLRSDNALTKYNSTPSEWMDEVRTVGVVMLSDREPLDGADHYSNNFWLWSYENSMTPLEAVERYKENLRRRRLRLENWWD